MTYQTISRSWSRILLFAGVLYLAACGPPPGPESGPVNLPPTREAPTLPPAPDSSRPTNPPPPTEIPTLVVTSDSSAQTGSPTATNAPAPTAIPDSSTTGSTTSATNPDCPAEFFLSVQGSSGTGGLPAPELSVSCDGTAVRVMSNSIPNHATGEFPNNRNPNRISPQMEMLQFPQMPATRGSATYLNNAAFGVAINGVEFDPIAAEYWNNDRNSGWNYDALPAGLGFDFNNAHVQPTGAYHYHGLPSGLIDLLGKVNAMTLIGFAADGFPIYARYGYSDPNDANSGIIEVQPSWQLKAGTRPGGPGGQYDGTFVEDWEYVAGSGNLDECNGRFGVTPEYPAGIYHYYMTDSFPNIPRCHMGTADGSFIIGPPGNR